MSDPAKLGYAIVRVETPKAVQFDTKEYQTIWVPKKAIHDDSECWNKANPKGELVVKHWFAEKKGWA